MSDSDRTIDSDELEDLISKAKQENSSSQKEINFLIQEPQSSSQVKKLPGKRPKLHEISESETDEELFPDTSESKHTGSAVKISKIDKDSVSTSDNHPPCKYGKMCYRKNLDHRRMYSHNFSDKKEKKHVYKSENSNVSSADFNNAYHFYLTKVHGIPQRFNEAGALDIKDILNFKGKLKASVQFNYMFDIDWLLRQYPEEFRKCPLIIVHGEQRESKQSLEKCASKYFNIKCCQAKLDIPFGTHHTKMMILLYEEGLKIVIHTSNLIEGDWFQKTQGMWVSPLFPFLDDGLSSTAGESPTNFKADLIEYLTAYGIKELEEWCSIIKKHDLSQAKVFIIGSIPGRHVGSRKTAFGHLKLRKVLNSHGPGKELVTSNWPVVGQFSSIGSLGANPEQWMCGEWLTSLSTVKGYSSNISSKLLKLVFPSVENVRMSLEGYPAGTSLPYSMKVATKQPYLKIFLHHWSCSKLGRSVASPHIKTYLRLSPNNANMAWFLVTSANLSKAAWGALEKKDTQFMIRSYELGVLYLPSKFGMPDVFSISNKQNGQSKPFPVPYDIPLTPYSNKDEPWIWDIPHVYAPDRYGNMWCPP